MYAHSRLANWAQRTIKRPEFATRHLWKPSIRPNHGESWTPTVENINALPEPIRRYMHDLATNADPAGTVADAICQRENAMALVRRVEELETELAQLKTYKQQ